MKIKSVVAIGAMGVGLGLAGLVGAGTAAAAPGDDLTNEAVAAEDATGAPWTDFFAAGPWEPFFDSTDGEEDGQGLWEDVFDRTDGVANDEEGAWEKAFPPAE